MADSALRSSHPVVLETQNLTKIFGGLTAVNDFDARVHKGEICSIIGPNGAGKTTVFNAVTGIYTPEKGHILFNGSDITGRKPHHVAKRTDAGQLSMFEGARPDAMESRSLEFHRRVRELFRELPDVYPRPVAVIDASADEETVWQRVREVVDRAAE